MQMKILIDFEKFNKKIPDLIFFNYYNFKTFVLKFSYTQHDTFILQYDFNYYYYVLLKQIQG